MKILFVRPKPHPDTIGLQHIMICEPLELEYLAAAVKGEHQVQLVDMILEKKSLRHFVMLHKPDLVAITAYISHVNVVKEYARVVKEVDPRIRVVVGGVHAEVVPGDYSDRDIDYVVNGNGISAFSKLVSALAKGTGKALEDEQLRHRLLENEPIQGVIPRGKAPAPCHNSEIPTIFPDRNLSARYRSRYYYMFHNPCALIKTSFGCPFSCNFCFCREITRHKYVTRELTEVIEEIRQIQEAEIYIVDDNFLVSAARVREFCRLLRQNGINKRFLIYGRADFIAANEEIIAEFARVGLRAVIVGMESPLPDELDRYNKGSSVEVNEKAAAALKRYGVECYATLILGLDWEKRHFDTLSSWLIANKLRFINLQPLTPLPGTALYERYQDRLIIPRERFERWDLANLVVMPERLSIRKYYFHMLRVYFKITFRPQSVLKNLKYGLVPCLKLGAGVQAVTWQYLLKLIKGR